MTKTVNGVFSRALLGTMAIVLLLGYQAAAQQVRMPKIEPTEWCGTQRIYEEKHLQKFGESTRACAVEGPCDSVYLRDSWIYETGAHRMTVRLAIHILAEDDGQFPTYTEAEVWDNVDGLNADYEQAGIQFVATIDTVKSTEWKLLQESEIDDLKNASAVSPDSCLNVWLPYVDFSYSFGTFPWSSDATGNTGGIVMGQFHFQGGANSVFSHEVGHCLGLWHTFHGVDEVDPCGACYEYVGAPTSEADWLGDFCSDTPPTPLNRECDNYPGNDSCTGLSWGATQPENYMNYSPEFCLTLFTPQQTGRMRCWVSHQLEGWLLPVYSAAENTFGPAPLDVDFAASTHKDVIGWNWQFGDGETSSSDTLTHTYTQPGYHTVSIELEATDGTYDVVHEGWVSAYADTIALADVQTTAGTAVAVTVNVRNYLPLKEIHLPFTWDGPLGIIYDSFSTAGLRTAYFDLQTQPNYDFFNSRACVILNCSNSEAQPYLEPGEGPVLKLWFTVPAGASGPANEISLVDYSIFSHKLISYAGEYVPEVTSGSVNLGCCTGPSVGNMDSSADNQVTMADLTVMIDHLFITLTPLICDAEGDVDLSGAPNPVNSDITMADLTVMIDHLFITLAPLPACP